ncbi:conserved exported protein of unknown function [Tenacibaculum sp. 190524A02b]|uniref:DUF6970 domain-containing protein n=1 Tax=Tenacibaculum vairaonense TaxID=3137860 RepID=A0ABM9PPX5_9FLAO
MKTTVLLLTLVFFFSCADNDVKNEVCGVENPIEQLAWLKKKKEDLEKMASPGKKHIIQYTYKNQPVFLIDACVDCADGLQYLFNCAGEKICEFGGIDGRNTCPDFDKTKTNKIVLWGN